jgi:hypothetical protein
VKHAACVVPQQHDEREQVRLDAGPREQERQVDACPARADHVFGGTNELRVVAGIVELDRLQIVSNPEVCKRVVQHVDDVADAPGGT